jgi:hypothetical protein
MKENRLSPLPTQATNRDEKIPFEFWIHKKWVVAPNAGPAGKSQRGVFR